MSDAFVIQHRTSKRYLAASPSLCNHQELFGVADTASASDAARWTSAEAAEQERTAIEDFADTFAVMPVPVDEEPGA